MVTKEQILAALEPTKLPCVRITPQLDKTPAPTDSKFGGDFCLPAGQTAPDMEFLAQINFAQIPHLKGFPETGLLQFFLCTEAEKFEAFIEDAFAWRSDAGFFQARWYPEVPADGPAHPDEVPEARWAMDKVTGGMGFETGEETASIAFGNDCDFVSDLGFETGAETVEKLFLADYQRQEAGEPDENPEGYDLGDCGGVIDLTEDFGNWGFKLGGHPSLRSDDLRLDDTAYAAYSVLLFQFDLTLLSQRCDADTICFFIRPEDLNACRFDDILMVHHNCY
ncbi:YwqG family protein [Oscillospiraceae bacterium 38-13]